jgi:hypothetical protein
MTNNTLFCGIALVVIGLYSFFVDSPTWDKRLGQYFDAHDAAVEKYPEAKREDAKAAEPAPNQKHADVGGPVQKLKKDPSKQNFTALIPAGLGAVLLLVVVVVVYKPDLRKHAMHFGAVVGLAAVGGGLYALAGGMGDFNLLNGWTGPTLLEQWPKIVNDPNGKVGVWDQPKVRSGGLTSLVGLVYVGLAVKSFIDARKAREAGAPAA